MRAATVMRHRYEPEPSVHERAGGATFIVERCAHCGLPARNRIHLVLASSR